MDCPATPECDKLKSYYGEITVIRRFLEFIEERGLLVAGVDEHDCLYPASLGNERLIHEHFGIDRDRLEQERRALLDYQRSFTERAGPTD